MQKSYVDQHREFKEFKVGEHVYLCIKPKRSSLRIGHVKRWNLSIAILERIRPVAYRLVLPPTMKVHDDFHVSFLKRYVQDVDHVIDCFIL